MFYAFHLNIGYIWHQVVQSEPSHEANFTDTIILGLKFTSTYMCKQRV